jgi:lipoprotein signal peptidase
LNVNAMPPDARRKPWEFFGLALCLVAVDAVTKALAVALIPPWLGYYYYPWLAFEMHRNYGVGSLAIGVGVNRQFTLVGTALVIVLLASLAKRPMIKAWRRALTFMLGGALGNLADQCLRSPGFGKGGVPDWIVIYSGQTLHAFNLADCFLMFGQVLAVWLLLVTRVHLDGKPIALLRRQEKRD